ncbi:ATP-binding protein [Thermopolyspora sp. NPDC052614]|uniref:ATP-binding protein n=1 Tax=Thermopolyspora sp. NPDC052614 TaxID=3155682 RepID=UPI0034224715
MTQPDMAVPQPDPPGTPRTRTPPVVAPAVQVHGQPLDADGPKAVSRHLGHIRLPAREQSAGRARGFVREILTPRFLQVSDEVVLLVSELVANSVRHSDSAHRPGETVTLTLREPIPGTLRVAVTDSGSPVSEPRPRLDGDHDDEHGRGLLLVESIATKWGWYEAGTGRTTWFELALPATG